MYAEVVELGRHARLRGVWGNPCGFESRLRHQAFSFKIRNSSKTLLTNPERALSMMFAQCWCFSKNFFLMKSPFLLHSLLWPAFRDSEINRLFPDGRSASLLLSAIGFWSHSSEKGGTFSLNASLAHTLRPPHFILVLINIVGAGEASPKAICSVEHGKPVNVRNFGLAGTDDPRKAYKLCLQHHYPLAQ